MSENISVMKEEIRRRAEEESKNTVSNSKKEAQKIVSSAKDRANKVRTEKVKPEAVTMRRKIIGLAELEGRRSAINAKEEVLSKVFEGTKNRLDKIARHEDKNIEYDEILFKMIKEAASEIGEEKLLITANKSDLSYISSNLSSITQKLKKELGSEVNLTIIKEPQNYIGGVVVYNGDRNKIFNNTLKGRLSQVQGTMRGRISKNLFVESA